MEYKIVTENLSWDLFSSPINCDPKTDYELIPFRDRQAGKFSKIPLSASKHYPPTARLLNMLTYLTTMEPPDKPGGWYKMTTGRSSDFHLTNKDIRYRALSSLETKGVIEVQRATGKSPYVRFTPSAAKDFLAAGSLSKFKNS